MCIEGASDLEKLFVLTQDGNKYSVTSHFPMNSGRRLHKPEPDSWINQHLKYQYGLWNTVFIAQLCHWTHVLSHFISCYNCKPQQMTNDPNAFSTWVSCARRWAGGGDLLGSEWLIIVPVPRDNLHIHVVDITERWEQVFFKSVKMELNTDNVAGVSLFQLVNKIKEALTSPLLPLMPICSTYAMSFVGRFLPIELVRKDKRTPHMINVCEQLGVLYTRVREMLLSYEAGEDCWRWTGEDSSVGGATTHIQIQSGLVVCVCFGLKLLPVSTSNIEK